MISNCITIAAAVVSLAAEPASYHEVRMTLSAETATIYPWSTSSWSLRCENMGGSALPFSSLALSGNYFGARLLAKLENVETGEQRVFFPAANGIIICYGGQPALFSPTESKNVTFQLTGYTERDWSSGEMADGPIRVFHPWHAEPGSYALTLTFEVNREVMGSTTVRFSVAPPPEASKAAFEALLASPIRDRLIDAKRISLRATVSELAAVQKFADDYAGTFYGDQTSLVLGSWRLRAAIFWKSAREGESEEEAQERVRALLVDARANLTRDLHSPLEGSALVARLRATLEAKWSNLELWKDTMEARNGR